MTFSNGTIIPLVDNRLLVIDTALEIEDITVLNESSIPASNKLI